MARLRQAIPLLRWTWLAGDEVQCTFTNSYDDGDGIPAEDEDGVPGYNELGKNSGSQKMADGLNGQVFFSQLLLRQGFRDVKIKILFNPWHPPERFQFG
ncbi:MAG: hypothetical protein R3F53_15695 [Gammaproteobacteria bacterium]